MSEFTDMAYKRLDSLKGLCRPLLGPSANKGMLNKPEDVTNELLVFHAALLVEIVRLLEKRDAD